ncbi:MAG: Derlin-2 [Marteilia pararefringens]
MDGGFLRDFVSLPPVTKGIVIASVVVSTLSPSRTNAQTIDVISPYSLYFDLNAVVLRGEWWRCFTSFLFFGNLGINSLFAISFMSRYSRMLEEQLYFQRSLDYLCMILVSAALIMACVVISPVKSMESLFLGYSHGMSLMYFWSRLNPEFKFSFFGLLTFSAPYLPWIILVISNLLAGECYSNIIGIIVGHIIFYLDQRLPIYTERNLLRFPQCFRNASTAFRDYLDDLEKRLSGPIQSNEDPNPEVQRINNHYEDGVSQRED